MKAQLRTSMCLMVVAIGSALASGSAWSKEKVLVTAETVLPSVGFRPEIKFQAKHNPYYHNPDAPVQDEGLSHLNRWDTPAASIRLGTLSVETEVFDRDGDPISLVSCQWFKIDGKGNETLIQDTASCSYKIPFDKGLEGYYIKALVLAKNGASPDYTVMPNQSIATEIVSGTKVRRLSIVGYTPAKDASTSGFVDSTITTSAGMGNVFFEGAGFRITSREFVPPVVYTSTNNAIAEVNSSGHLILKAPGHVFIRGKDKAGEIFTLEYNFKYQLIQIDDAKVTYQEAKDACERKGTKLPDINSLSTINSQWNGIPNSYADVRLQNVHDQFHWSSTSVDGGHTYRTPNFEKRHQEKYSSKNELHNFITS